VHEDEYLATLGVEQHYVVVERFATRPLSAVVATVGRESSNKTEQRSWARLVKAENQWGFLNETMLVGGDTKLWESKCLMDSITVDVDDGCTGGADIISLQVGHAIVSWLLCNFPILKGVFGVYILSRLSEAFFFFFFNRWDLLYMRIPPIRMGCKAYIVRHPIRGWQVKEKHKIQ
jgi:hypothetical protein